MKCPLCKKTSHEAFAPFCSERCKNLDLSRWFEGAYAIPSEEDVLEEDGQGDDKVG